MIGRNMSIQQYPVHVQKILYAIIARGSDTVKIRARFPLPNNPDVSATDSEIFLNYHPDNSSILQHHITEWVNSPLFDAAQQKNWFGIVATHITAALATPSNIDHMGFIVQIENF